MKTPSLDACKMINLPKISDPRGNLTFIESGNHIPFDVKRVFYLYHIPEGADRGAHALKTCYQLLIASAGSFDVIIDDGSSKARFHLDQPNQALLIPPPVWREMENFSPGSVCLVLASERYAESDYYRNYEDFIATTNA